MMLLHLKQRIIQITKEGVADMRSWAVKRFVEPIGRRNEAAVLRAELDAWITEMRVRYWLVKWVVRETAKQGDGESCCLG